MQRLIITFLFLIFLNSSQAQDLINKNLSAEADSNMTSSGSTVFSHVKKAGMYPNGEEYSCGLEFSNSPYLIYTISQQSDLIYFEAYYDTSYINIKEQGYFRLNYINSLVGYCWQKDLVWNSFDESGNINKKEYYSKGILINIPLFSQQSILETK
ncbi:MAG: hypothetical protein WAT43_10555 [Chitinophagales bacterium]